MRQHPVQCADTTYWIDCASPQWRVAVEGVGDTFHRSPRNGGVLPVTWNEITDTPDTVVASIVTTLAA